MDWDDFIDNLFDNLRRDIYSNRRYSQSDRTTDIIETENKIFITLDWRSYNIEELNIELKHDVISDILVVVGTSPTNYISKVIRLPKHVREGFTKSINNGVVSIELDVDKDVEVSGV